MRKAVSKILLLIVLIFLTSNSFSAEKLKFADKPKKYGGSIRNAVFAPAKDSNNIGRALIVLPTCGGIVEKTENAYKAWIKFFIAHGYTVLMVDHYTPRKIPKGNGCSKKRILLPNHELSLDVLDATEHLSKMPGINKNKIFSIGFSLGTMANSNLASKAWYNTFGDKRLRPRALGGLYGSCNYGGGAATFLHRDSNIPIFWLMGSKDLESPASNCISNIEEIEKRKETKIYWHLYEGATHCWDCKDLNGYRKKYLNGNTGTYRYNKKFTEDSMNRALEFFNSFK